MTPKPSSRHPLTPADLQTYLDEHDLAGEIIVLDVPTPTVETAAQAVNCRPEQIVKSILFLIGEQSVLAVTCGLQHIERRTIARHFGVGRKQVRLADGEAMLRIGGYPVGAMPPFGHYQPLPTLLDPTVLEQEVVYAGGGSGQALLRIAPQLIDAHTNATILDLHSLPDPGD